MLDLQPFCSTDVFRPYLLKPFSRNGFTYATDGHVMVRVTLRPDVPDVDKAFNPDGPLQGIDGAMFSRPSFELPSAPTEKGECPACDGRGFDHECPDCECICESCKGEGDIDVERRISAAIGLKIFSLHYIRMMLSLPGIEMATLPNQVDEKPILFRFSDGVGALMPLRSAWDNHVDIKLDLAA